MKLEAPQKGRVLTLNDFTTKEIKGFIQKYNNSLKIKGYSKVYKKEGLISLINKHPLVEVVGNMDSVRFNVSGAQVKGMDMLYKFKPKKVVIKKMIKKKKVVEEKPKKEKAPPKPKKEKAPPKPKKENSAVDNIVDLKEAMSPIFDKKFNPKSVVDRIKSMKDIDDINKEITIIQKNVKETASKLKSTGKETEAERKQLQKLQEKYTKRLKSIIKSLKENPPKKEKAPPKEAPKTEKITTSLKNLLTYITKKSVYQDGGTKTYLLFNTEEIIKKTKKVNVGDSEKGKELKKMILDSVYVDKTDFGGIKGTRLLNNDDNIYRLAFEILNGRKPTNKEPVFSELKEKEVKKEKKEAKEKEKKEKKEVKEKAKKEKAPPKKAKKPPSAKQIEARKKFAEASKARAKKKKEVSVSFD